MTMNSNDDEITLKIYDVFIKEVYTCRYKSGLYVACKLHEGHYFQPSILHNNNEFILLSMSPKGKSLRPFLRLWLTSCSSCNDPEYLKQYSLFCLSILLASE